MSIRLLYLTAESWPTFRADVAVLFGKYLPRHGVYADIVAGATHEPASSKWEGGDTILCNIHGGRCMKHLKIFLHGVKYLFQAERERYNAVQVRDMPLLAAFGLFAAHMKGMQFYYWMSYPMPEGQISLARARGLSAGLMNFLFPWVRGHVGRFLLYKLVLPAADHIFVQSDRMKVDMMGRGLAPRKMSPVLMGVDTEAFLAAENLPAEDPRLAGRRVVAYLGTLDPPRRIEILFEMLALVKVGEPQVLLVLAGDTADDVHRRWLKEKAREFGVAQDVIWTGWLPMIEAWRYVRASEVGLSPLPRGFLYDGASPTKVPEYLALGIPVVCSDNPDQRAIIEKSGAGRCVPFSASDFARAVVDLLRLDQAERQAIGERGRSFVSNSRGYQLLAADVAAVYVRLQKGITQRVAMQSRSGG